MPVGLGRPLLRAILLEYFSKVILAVMICHVNANSSFFSWHQPQSPFFVPFLSIFGYRHKVYLLSLYPVGKARPELYHNTCLQVLLHGRSERMWRQTCDTQSGGRPNSMIEMVLRLPFGFQCLQRRSGISILRIINRLKGRQCRG